MPSPRAPDSALDSIPYYEAYAEAYERRSARSLPLAALREFAALLTPGARVLDAGCGTGRDLAWLAARGLRVEGFDGAEAMVELARRRAPGAERIWRADFRVLQLERESYDGIWAHRSLIHLPPPGVQRVLQQLFASLRRGGILLLAMEEGEGVLDEHPDAPEGAEPRAWRRIYRYPHAELSSLLRQSGFTLLREGRELEHPRHRAYLARRQI